MANIHVSRKEKKKCPLSLWLWGSLPLLQPTTLWSAQCYWVSMRIWKLVWEPHNQSFPPLWEDPFLVLKCQLLDGSLQHSFFVCWGLPKTCCLQEERCCGLKTRDSLTYCSSQLSPYSLCGGCSCEHWHIKGFKATTTSHKNPPLFYLCSSTFHLFLKPSWANSSH